MSRPRVTHQAISASAGSGKTFRLAHRYIQLMDYGVSPDRICALTFSRKAAGEIFDSIVGYIWRAAADDKARRSTAQHIQRPGAKREDFLRLLRQFVDSLHRTHIGTLDSFIVGILKAFPTELGIATEFQVMDNGAGGAQGMRSRVLNTIFDPRYVKEPEQDHFLEAFKQATFGKEEKQLERNLAAFIDRNRARYQEMPEAEAWGVPGRIWPQGCKWLSPPKTDPAQAADAFRRGVAGSSWPDKALEASARFADYCAAYTQTSLWDAKVAEGAWGKRLFEVLGDLEQGAATVRFNRKDYALVDGVAQALHALAHHVIAIELERALRQTRGIFGVLAQYEQYYDDAMRRAGTFTFDDAQYLLTGANTYSGGALLSRRVAAEDRLYIDYRLDCKLDHWLIDEFQDTSDLQWAVLRNIVDEILQDAEGNRSYFYVGDVKQAIYGWRGGNARLFRRILQEYEGIEELSMGESYRSAQPVIDAVNTIFGNLERVALPPGVMTDWRSFWQDHSCARGNVPKHGCAAVIEPVVEEGGKVDKDAHYRIAACLLREIDPVRRGLSCALLVRSNDAGSEIVDFLRRECPECPVVLEGKAGIRDNPAVELILALVKFAGHPGDTLAWRHLQMSPLAATLDQRQIDRGRLPLVLLRRLHEGGFEALVREWSLVLGVHTELTGFEKQRLAELAGAAAEFDESGVLDGDGFLTHVDAYEVREMAHERTVRVMTIHQSKGLGFDVVILPELMGQGLAAAKPLGVAVGREREKLAPCWALQMPRNTIARTDAVLADQAERLHNDACLEELCVLYVALTRARQGMYMITSDPGRTLNAGALIKQALTGDAGAGEGETMELGGGRAVCLWAAGEHDWYRRKAPAGGPQEAPRPAEWPEDFAARDSRRKRLARLEPSMEAEGERPAAWLFDSERQDVLDFGRAIHELFAMVEWADDADPEAIVKSWRPASKYSEPVNRDVCDQFRRAFESPEVVAALSRPGRSARLWREKSFEIVVDDSWVSGTFDRVVLEETHGGRPAGATVIDFKSNRIRVSKDLDRAVRTYRTQLGLYRKALAGILKIDAAKIRRQLLFTVPGKVRDVKGR